MPAYDEPQMMPVDEDKQPREAVARNPDATESKRVYKFGTREVLSALNIPLPGRGVHRSNSRTEIHISAATDDTSAHSVTGLTVVIVEKTGT